MHTCARSNHTQQMTWLKWKEQDQPCNFTRVFISGFPDDSRFISWPVSSSIHISNTVKCPGWLIEMAKKCDQIQQTDLSTVWAWPSMRRSTNDRHDRVRDCRSAPCWTCVGGTSEGWALGLVTVKLTYTLHKISPAHSALTSDWRLLIKDLWISCHSFVRFLPVSICVSSQIPPQILTGYAQLYSHLTDPRIDSGSTATVSSIKPLLKMNELSIVIQETYERFRTEVSNDEVSGGHSAFISMHGAKGVL